MRRASARNPRGFRQPRAPIVHRAAAQGD
jgi:hypothetical protein